MASKKPTTMQDFRTNGYGSYTRYPCPMCRTTKEPQYVCRNLQSIGFFEGFRCGNKNCKHMVSW